MSSDQLGFYGEPVSPYRGRRIRRSAEAQKAIRREWRAKNADWMKDYHRKWRNANADLVKDLRRRWSAENPKYGEEWRAKNPKYGREYRAKNQERLKTDNRERREADKKELFELLGKECVCCGEDDFSALEIDHVNGDGAAHRTEFGAKSILYRYYFKHLKAGTLKRPIQTLCSRCNLRKGTDLSCPCRYAKAKNSGRGRNVSEPFFVG